MDTRHSSDLKCLCILTLAGYSVVTPYLSKISIRGYISAQSSPFCTTLYEPSLKVYNIVSFKYCDLTFTFTGAY